MRHTLDLFKIVAHYGQDINVVARVLYPNVHYPQLAIKRIKQGKADLTLSQVYRLADFLGVFVTDLFEVDTWKGSGLDKDAIKLEKGEYTALIRPNGLISLRKGAETIYNGVLSGLTSIDELLSTLNKIIENGNN